MANVLTMKKVAGIAFIGPIGSGKSTTKEAVSNRWVENRPSDKMLYPMEISFALALKKEVARFLAESLHGGKLDTSAAWDTYDRIFTEMHHPELKKKYRTILQWWGTEWRRAQDEDYWVKKLLETIDSAPRNTPIFLIDDCRFPNEYAALKTLGFRFVRLHPNPDYTEDTGHESEQHHPFFDVDYELAWLPVDERIGYLYAEGNQWWPEFQGFFTTAGDPTYRQVLGGAE